MRQPFNPLLLPGEPPDHDGIVKAARLIAGAEPPDWLLAALVVHSRIVGGDHLTTADVQQIEARLLDMQRSINQLLATFSKFKPVLGSLLDENLAADIRLALEVLPRIAEGFPKLRPAPHRAGGQRPDGRTRICAGLVVDGWRMIQGIEPASGGKDEGDACQTYWEACGHSNVRDWGREIEEAIAKGSYRSVLEAFARPPASIERAST
jgi:hypothetical protein